MQKTNDLHCYCLTGCQEYIWHDFSEQNGTLHIVSKDILVIQE